MILLAARMPTPIIIAPAIMTGFAPIRSMNRPANGADRPIAMAPTAIATDSAVLLQPRSSTIGLKKTVNVFKTEPYSRNITAKQASVTPRP